MGIIYKAENLVTGEVYIGQTKKPLCEKKRDHVYEAFKRYATNKFHKALREFGLKNFDWSIVDECNDYARLSKMERNISRNTIALIMVITRKSVMTLMLSTE